MVLLSLIAGSIVIIGMSIKHPTLLQDTAALIMETPYGERAQRVLESFAEATVGPAPFVGVVLATLLLLKVVLWILRSWGAHRRVLKKRRWHSLIATLLLIGML